MSQDSNKDPTKETIDDQKSASNDHEDFAQTPENISTTSQPPLNDGQLTNEPSITRQPSDPLCVICLDPITDRTVADPCFHEFCRRCIEQLFVRTSECPICRRQIVRIMFNFRGPLDYDQRDVGERDQVLDHLRDDLRQLLTNVNDNRQHPENDAQLRQHLIENPREFVTVNVGQNDEFLLPSWTISRFARTTVSTDHRGVYLIQQSANQIGEYRVMYLQPNQVHSFMNFRLDWCHGFNRLVSPDRLESAIHELVIRRYRYAGQRQQLQLQNFLKEGFGMPFYHSDINPRLRRDLFDEPRKFVTVNIGQEDEYLLPASEYQWSPIDIYAMRMFIRTDDRGVYLIRPDREEDILNYTVRYLRPNRTHVLNYIYYFNGFTRFVSPDRLESSIHELENRRNRYQQQQLLRQQNQPVGGVNGTDKQQEKNADE